MSVDRKAVDDMARIMAALNQQTADAVSREDLIESAEPARPMAATAASLGDPGIDAMKDILLRMRGVAEGAPSQPQPRDPVLLEALQTEPTSRGARIGSWEIVKNPGNPVTYDVVSDDDLTIASDLYLYEAALGLVRQLNDGVAINSRPVRELLQLEENYVRARQDALGQKNRAKKMHQLGESKRAEVAEHRFDEAQRQALTAHEEILRLAGLR